MGMYTELVLNVGLKHDIPADVLTVLRAMTAGEGRDLTETPKHPLFSTDRWSFMLRSGSFYFVPKSTTELVESFPEDPHPTRHLSVRTDLKNYGNEIDLFVDWLAPYVEAYGEDFGGYKRYEEDEHPTLVYFDGTKAIWRPVNGEA